MDYYRKQILRLSVNDYIPIIQLAQKRKKDTKYLNENSIRIGVIGSSSLQYFIMVLRIFLAKYSISADLYEGLYDGIHTSVFDHQSKLYEFQPQIVIILTNFRDIHDMPELLSSEEAVDHYIRFYGKYYQELWNQISEIKGCYIFQSNIVVPIERELGNLESNVYYSKENIYRLLNIELLKNRLKNVTIIDMEYLASFVGKENWFDRKMYFANKLDFSLKYIGLVCDVFAQQISALKGNVKKCLILDLDHTLWGGVVADEGVEGIQISPDNPVGEAYRFFQQYVRRLKNRGVILAVISKNDYETAVEPFKLNKNMVLKYDDFSSFIANWNNKASNIELVAKELCLSTDSFVFFDDNPAERESIRMYHPEVLVVDVPEDVGNYVKALEQTHAFDWIRLTKEDITRGDSYKNNTERKKLNELYKDYHKYLEALDMKGKIDYLKEKDLDRFVQLIHKSNQFNTRTKRYTEADIKNRMASEEYCLLSVTLEDRFSKFGIISCVILEKQEEECLIDTWVMSCRVLKRNVEYFIHKKLIEVAKKWGCKHLIGEYIPTSKNKMVERLFLELGFQEMDHKDTGRYLYIYDTDLPLEKIIEIKEMDER